MAATLRTIPIRFPPVRGESLESWLWAYAYRLRTKPADLMSAVGLHRPARGVSPDFTIRLFASEVADLAFVTGIAPTTVREMTLERYSARALYLRDDKTRCIDRFHLWSRPTGSRFCPHCLDESGGRWQLSWRLSWSFACVKHKCLLADHCPECGMITRGFQGVGHLVEPGHCTSRLAGQPRSARCRAELARAQTMALRSEHRVLRAQSWITNLIDGQAPDGEVRAVITDLSAIMGRIFTQRRRDLLDGAGKPFGEHFAAANESGDIKLHRATFPVLDANLTAGALTVAIEVLDDIRDKRTSRTLTSIVDRDVVTRWSTSPSNYFTEWNFGSTALRTAVITTHADRLANVDGLRYRVATADARVPKRTPELAVRHTKIPQMCWRGIALALNPGIGARVCRLALSVAMLLPANPQRDLTVLAESLQIGPTNHVSRLLRELKRSTGDAGAQAICALVEHLDALDPVIDYSRRREVIGPHLLPDRDWERICRRLHIEPGRGLRVRLARSHLYSVLTGNSPANAPGPLRIGRPAELTQLMEFEFRITSVLAAALDEYAYEYLTQHGIDGEPVRWAPPLEIVAHFVLPGPRLGEVAWSEVHEMIDSADPSCTQIATRFGTSREHIRCILIDHPRLPRPAAPRTVASASLRYREVQKTLTPDVFAMLATRGVSSVRAIAAHTGVTRRMVDRRMRDLSIPVHPPGGRTKFVVDRDWLFNRYVRDQRTYRQIAEELDTSAATVQRLCHEHDIPNRPRGGASHIAAIRIRHDGRTNYPEPLRLVLTGEGAWNRLRQLEAIVEHRSVRAAAAALGTSESVLSTHLARLEREMKCRLVNRSTAKDSVTLTQDGQALLRQYHRHSGNPPS